MDRGTRTPFFMKIDQDPMELRDTTETIWTHATSILQKSFQDLTC